MEPFDLREWNGFKAAGGDSSEPAMVDEVSIDSRTISSSNSLFVALQGKKSDGHNYVGQAKYSLVRKGFSCSSSKTTLLSVEDPLTSMQRIAQAYRKKRKAKTIAITGSYGKTLSKDLLHAILSRFKHTTSSPESFNSQIGVPLSLFQIQAKDEVAIIEAGISEIGEMKRLAQTTAPDHAILTNIGEEHLETLGSLETIQREKLNLLESVPKEGWILLPSLTHTFQAISYFYNKKTASLPFATWTDDQTYQIEFPDGEVWSTPSPNPYQNFIAQINICIQAAWLIQPCKQAIIETLSHYAPEPMRTEIWKTPEGATFINSSYCSDPLSLKSSLEQFKTAHKKGERIFLFGGVRKGSNDPQKIQAQAKKTIEEAAPSIVLTYGEKEAYTSYSSAAHSLKHPLSPYDLVINKGAEKIPFEQASLPFADAPFHNVCSIHLPSVRSNLEVIRKKLTPSCRMMVIIKALAYGTDQLQMAKFLASCEIDYFGLSSVAEGVRMRKSGLKQDLFILNATPEQSEMIAKWDLEIGVSDLSLIHSLEKSAKKLNKIIPVHLHINTGMNRFGCHTSNALQLAKRIVASPHLTLKGVMTHFSCAENPEQDAFTNKQIEQFDHVIQKLTENKFNAPYIHAANSAGFTRFHLPNYNLVRIGLAPFGLAASNSVRYALPLKQALSLTSKVVAINHCDVGDTISYGRTYTTQRSKQKIAVLPIGYHDGLHRSYSNKGEVMIRGKRAPIVGAICMDYCMVDISGIPDVKIGDSVLIFGTDHLGHTLPPEELAERGGSIVHELITCLGPRIQRVFIDE